MQHGRRKNETVVGVWVLVLLLCASVGRLDAHPGSGIYVDREGNVYFVDTGSGIWKIDVKGALTRLQIPAYHWMAFDAERRLARAELPSFGRGDAVVTRDAGDGSVLASSDFPITVGKDGTLYYPWMRSGEPLQIFRLSPSGSTSVFVTLSARSGVESHRGLNGLVASHDGFVYYTELRAIKKVGTDGSVTVVADNVNIPGCVTIPGVEAGVGPYLRGLDVDEAGNVYVAASGCGAVLKVSPKKQVSVILRSTSPWSPTAVAVSKGNVYVLEYLHTEGDDRRQWLPRVRKVSPDGTIITLATIER